MISDQILEDLSADFEKISEDIWAARRMCERSRADCLRHVIAWADYNMPKLEKLAEMAEKERKEEDEAA